MISLMLSFEKFLFNVDSILMTGIAPLVSNVMKI